METFNVEVGRTRTASGYEWFLLVNGERVRTNSAGIGYLRSHGARDDLSPAEILPRLLVGLLRADGALG